MKLGELVRLDIEPFKTECGIIIAVDKSNTRFPNDRIYYEVLTSTGRQIFALYEHLISSEDLHFGL
jgi:hypothetical protein